MTYGLAENIEKIFTVELVIKARQELELQNRILMLHALTTQK